MWASRKPTLSTQAGYTLQHGEVWSAEAVANFLGCVSSEKGINVMTAPSVTTPPGEKADIGTSDYRLSMTPRMSEDGVAFDIDLNVEVPKAFPEFGEAGP